MTADVKLSPLLIRWARGLARGETRESLKAKRFVTVVDSAEGGVFKGTLKVLDESGSTLLSLALPTCKAGDTYTICELQRMLEIRVI
jgi:hypothetical protein